MLTLWLGYNALTNANWNGSEVVEKSGHNIVMLDFNYRVGMWGFLASQRVKDDGDLNVGLLDQRMLLSWVKKHISAVCHHVLPRSITRGLSTDLYIVSLEETPTM